MDLRSGLSSAQSLKRVEGDVPTSLASNRHILKKEADGGRKDRVSNRLRGVSMMMGTKERRFVPLCSAGPSKRAGA